MRTLRSFFALLVVAGASAAPVLQVDSSASSVTVRNAAGGASVLVIGYQRFFRGYEPVFRRYERIIDADQSGRAELTLSAAQPEESFWVAIDLTTGAYGSATPPGSPARGGPLPARALLRGAGGRVQGIEADSDYAYFVVIRPTGGAWRATAGDGGPSDVDGRANGHVRVSTTALGKIRGQSTLGDLENGDLVFVFMTHRMTFRAGVVQP